MVTFARGCKYNLEEMKNRLEMFLTLKSSLPEFFTGWDPMKPELQSALEVGSVFLDLEIFTQIF